MDPWYLLKCPSCRATLRIKSDYVHMRGRCPACGMRVEPPLPKPLVMSDFDEPAGLMPQDEEWPEPATLLDKNNEVETGRVTAYALNTGTGQVTPQGPKIQEEEDTGGVYALAFDPDTPKVQGVVRSAEWDQSSVPTPALSVPATLPVQPTPVAPAAPPPASEPITPFVFKTEIDPLFGDEVKVAVPASQAPPAPVPPQPPVAAPVKPAPIARMATSEEIKSQKPAADTSEEGSQPVPTLKKKKKKTPEPTPKPTPEKPGPGLDTPTKETHQYALSDAEVNRIMPDAPPKTLFFDGVFGFPFAGKNVIPWIWLALGFTLNFLLMALIYSIWQNDSQMAKVGAGAMGMALFVLMVLVLSYGCACWFNTINYTSSGSIAVDWQTDGSRENVIHFLRVGYYFGVAMLMCTPFLVLNFFSIGTILWLLATLFVFPVFLFSGMASMTFWNFLNGDVIKRMMVKSHHYLMMYVLTIGLYVVAGAALYFAVQYAWLSFIAGPMFAGAWLIHGRLMGRMAYVLQQEPATKKRKKKKKKPKTEEEPEEVQPPAIPEPAPPFVSNGPDAYEFEKGPREDARGPGGARPV